MIVYDIALAPDEDGEIVVHCADCLTVRAIADAGLPVATLFGCDALPTDLPMAECVRFAGREEGALQI